MSANVRHKFRTMFGRARGLLQVPADDPAFAVVQFKAVLENVPLLYFILSTNIACLSITHFGDAPDYMALYIPSILISVFTVRGLIWLRGRRQQAIPAQAIEKLRTINFSSFFITVACLFWSISLLPHGNPYQNAHVAFFVIFTYIGCLFCLIPVRTAALIIALTVSLPFFVVMALTGEPTLIAAGVNVILATPALIAIAMLHYRDFRQLHESRSILVLQQKALEENSKSMQAMADETLRLANLDSLTRLANRRSFFQMLEEYFKNARHTGSMLTVGVIDLDGFKPVNDLYGHSAGDKVLVEIGTRLSTLADDRLSVYRLGGDEFGLLFQGDVAESDVMVVGQTVCERIAECIDIGGGLVQLNGSIGFAIYPTVGQTAQEVFDLADYALYTAKRRRRGSMVVFNAAQAKELYRHNLVEEALVSADFENELFLVFQPIISMKRRVCIGFEALARWESSRIGPVSPAEFIPIAERTGRITFITRLLFERALEAAAHWPENVYLSFNLSPHDVASLENTLKIVSIVLKSGFDPRRINFEITETAVMHDFQQVSVAIQMLRDLGAGISLDDFGTGYSSLSHVHLLPLTKIKIDRSFVRDIHTRKASFNIVKSVLALCAEMGLEAIVEGVETEDELRTMETLGAQAIQGYYFGKPMTALETHAVVGRLNNAQKQA